ncbi:MAG: LamG domain-containing protein, partial [Gemmatimonadota bacterium]
ISDASQNDGNQAFYWLAPIVSGASYDGVFNPDLKPKVVICRVDLEADPVDCAVDEDGNQEVLQAWTMTTGLKLSLEDEHYGFEWHTDQTETDFDATYRIQVFLTEAGSQRLGFADVQFFSDGKEMKNINEDETISLQDGRTLPGRFRIEKGASCNGEADCGEAVIGPSGGTVTTEAAFAGVEIPEGAVDDDVLITVRRVDPESQPWGDCLPTGLRQEEGCYEFDTEPELGDVNQQDAFNTDVVVGVCVDPDATRPDKLALHKYDPERSEEGVAELDGAAATFLSCDNFADADPVGLLGRFATSVRNLLRPAADFAVQPLYATDAGRGGITDAFSFIGWAEPVELSLESATTLLLPGGEAEATIQAVTTHNHTDPALEASGHTLRLVYTDPASAVEELSAAVTDAGGQASPAWTLTQEVGVHTLAVSTRMVVDGVEIPDPTDVLTVRIGGYQSADDCDGVSDCGQAIVDDDGGTVTTENGFAGVDVPAGALDDPVLITIRRVDPESQPWGDCLPTGLRQEEGCYEFDTEPDLGEVNQQDAFNEDVVVGVCVDPNAVREDRLTLHKFDPENASDGVAELDGAAATFLTCDNFAYRAPEGLFGRFAAAAGRAAGPLVRAVIGTPLYATDAGRGGITDAFSFIGWAEPVTLAIATEPDATTSGVTDVVVTALTAHNDDDPAVPSDGTTIRFEYTDPNGTVDVTEVVTAVVSGAAEARISLGSQPGTHTVTASTRQEILVDTDVIISGAGAFRGFFGAPNISLQEEWFLVPDPTAVVEADPVTVPGRVSLWNADGDSFLAEAVGPNHGTADGTVESAAGITGQGFGFPGDGGGTVTAGAANFGDAAEWTVATWVNLDQAGDPLAIQRFVTMGAAGNPKGVLRQEEAGEQDARQLHFYGGFGEGFEDFVHIRESNALLAGCWHHVAGTYDGSALTLYLDGTPVGTAPAPGSTVDADEITFSWPDEPMVGVLDEVEVHN